MADILEFKTETLFGGDNGLFEKSDEGLYINTQRINFKAVDYDEETEEEIVLAEASITGRTNFSCRETLQEVFDASSDDAINTYASLCEHTPNVDMEDVRAVLYLETLEVKEGYRGNGFGSELLQFIVDYLDNMFYEKYVLFFIACSTNNNDKDDSALVDFYKRNGAEVFYTDKENGTHLMCIIGADVY